MHEALHGMLQHECMRSNLAHACARRDMLAAAARSGVAAGSLTQYEVDAPLVTTEKAVGNINLCSICQLVVLPEFEPFWYRLLAADSFGTVFATGGGPGRRHG